MLLILSKKKKSPNEIECEITAAAEGIHTLGTLKFPNQIIWTRFQGALQRGCVGMRDVEVRIDVVDSNEQKEVKSETGSTGNK